MEVPGRLTLAQAGLSKDGADGAPQMHWKGRNAAPRSDQALVKSRAPPRVRRAGGNFPGVYLTFLGDFRMTADTPRGLIRGVRLPAMTGGQPLPALAVRRGSPFHRQVMETEKGGGFSTKGLPVSLQHREKEDEGLTEPAPGPRSAGRGGSRSLRSPGLPGHAGPVCRLSVSLWRIPRASPLGVCPHSARAQTTSETEGYGETSNIGRPRKT